MSDERHYGDYVCLICQNLVDLDSLATTPCSHCFCRTCLEEWIGRVTNNAHSQFLQHDGGSSSNNAPRCPTCSHDLVYSSKYGSMMIGKQSVTVQPLHVCQPLAYRVLKKIKVSCPLNSRVACTWEGDYGDVNDHLLSETAHEDCDVPQVDSEVSNDANANQSSSDKFPARHSQGTETVNSVATREMRHLALAQSFKEEGNDRFASGHNDEAKELYTKAISMLPGAEDNKLKATLLSNRAAAFLNLEKYSDCVQDCKKALNLDPTYLKVYVRKARCLTQQGKLHQAVETWLEASQKCNDESQTVIKKEQRKAECLNNLMNEGREQLKQGRYGTAKAAFGKVLRDTSAADALLGAAKSDLGLGLTESAMRLSLQIIKGFPDHVAEGYEVRGGCLFLMGDFDGGKKFINEALRQAPDLVSAQKLRRQCNTVLKQVKGARDHSFHRRFESALQLFTSAIGEYIGLPPKSALYCILYSERAEAYLRLKQYDAALKDCSLVLSSREDYKQTWLVNLQALHGLGRHETAKAHTEQLLKTWGANDTEIRQANNKADFEVRKMRRLDIYKLLGVSPVASELEIKQAYRRKSLDCHPNNVANSDMSPTGQKAAAERYRILGDAFEILCDELKRQLYDEGYDQKSIQERVDKAKKNARTL